MSEEIGKYTEATAKAKLKRHNITVKGGQITLKRCGIGVWGAIDYLCNRHGYNYMKEEPTYG
jgi:hypothetical protein